MSGEKLPPGFRKEEPAPRLTIRAACTLNRDGLMNVAVIVQRGGAIITKQAKLKIDGHMNPEILTDMEKVATVTGETCERAVAEYFRSGFGKKREL